MKKLFPIALALIMLLSACGTKNPVTTTTATPEPSAVSVAPEPSTTPEPITNPLTGETISKDISTMRPYAVMLNDIKVALPQCGISKADILYEVLAEGNITRFEGIFSDLNGVGVLGSMRSSRPYYIELALSYDAIYVHAGGSDQAYSDISSKGVDNIDGVRGAYASNIFYRDPTREKYGIEHAMFTTSDKLLEYTSKLGYNSEHTGNFSYGLSFTDKVDMGSAAAAASSVDVNFSGIKKTDFAYHTDSGLYTARQYDTDLVDGTTKTAVTFKNLLVLYADTKIIDDYGRRSVNLTGTGTGYFICDGKSVPIKWSHSGTGKNFTYTLENGSSVQFGIGKTYIGIVSTDSKITMQ